MHFKKHIKMQQWMNFFAKICIYQNYLRKFAKVHTIRIIRKWQAILKTIHVSFWFFPKEIEYSNENTVKKIFLLKQFLFTFFL